MTPPSERPEYGPPSQIRELPSFMVSEVFRVAARLVGEQLATEGFRRQHFTVLAALADAGAASQADLGRRLWIDRSDLHALLTELERDGLIDRVQDERDRRRNLVALTSDGRATLKRLSDRVDLAQDALLEPLSEADRRTLRRLLHRLSDAHGHSA